MAYLYWRLWQYWAFRLARSYRSWWPGLSKAWIIFLSSFSIALFELVVGAVVVIMFVSNNTQDHPTIRADAVSMIAIFASFGLLVFVASAVAVAISSRRFW